MVSNIIYGQDSTPVHVNAIQSFNLKRGDTRYKKEDQTDFFDFVGFVLNEYQTLAVFPKHYFSDDTLLMLNQSGFILEEDIQLLFDVIYHYVITEKTSASATKYMGNDPEYEADYPFAAFFAIYNYYRQFGIYQERIKRTVPDYKGKISWKNTIRKSSKIINDDNLIFAPLYVKKNNAMHVFISDCMAFVINYTIGRFPYFLSLPRVKYKSIDYDFFHNHEYVLGLLRKAKNEVFKDIHRRLIQNLIEFFEYSNECLKGGEVHIKINYFDKIWEKMVHKYLNDYFLMVNEKEQKLVFDTSQYSSTINFNSKAFKVDESDHGYTITPDHYANYKENQYVFDSKYYDDISTLNYKQMVYYDILSANTAKSGTTYAALLLPGEKAPTVHYKLARAYKKDEAGCEIMEHYLNTKDVMKHYVGG